MNRPVLPVQAPTCSQRPLSDLSEAELCRLHADLATQLAAVELEQQRRKRASIADDASLCVICQDSGRCLVFYPCRHLACCEECGGHLATCPLCRSDVLRCDK